MTGVAAGVCWGRGGKPAVAAAVEATMPAWCSVLGSQVHCRHAGKQTAAGV